MKIKLYHGTTTKHLGKILKQGITPRHNRPSNWDKHPSRNDMVYLTNAYAIWFAQVATKENESPVVLEVLADEKRLYPDEDFLEQATRSLSNWQEFHRENTLAEKTKMFRDNLLDDWQDQTNKSLQHLGNASHKGTIKLKNILRYVVLNKDPLFAFGDPSITIQNYFILGPKYRKQCLVDMWQEPIAKEVIVI